METYQKFVPLWKGILPIVLTIAMGVVVSNIIKWDGYCAFNPFPGFVIECKFVWLGFLVLTLLSSLALVQLFWWLTSVIKKRIKTPSRQNTVLKKSANGQSIILHSKELRFPRIFISHIRIFIRGEDIPVSCFEEHFSLKRWEHKVFPFIQHDSKANYFTIANPHDEDNVRQFKEGNFEFDIDVVYGYSEKHADKIKRFVTTVSYNRESGARIGEIKHADL